MGPALSAVVVLSALAASAVLLVHLVVTEGRRRDRRTGAGRRRSSTPWPPALSSDGAWAWTGSGWVPARWDAVSVLPPGPAPMPGRRPRSHGCLWAAGVGCVVLLSMAGAVVLVVLVLLAGLVSLLSAALGG